MTHRTVACLDDLKHVEPDDIVRIYNLNVDEQEIHARKVSMFDCMGGYVSITADTITVDAGSFTLVDARATEFVDLREASIHRLVTHYGLEGLAIDKSNIRDLVIGRAQFVHITKSWVQTLHSESIDLVRLFESYIGTADTTAHKPVIFARGAAIASTNWPFVDGGADLRGYRVNVFEGARTTDSGVVVTSLEQLNRSEPAVVVTAGCRAFTSVEDAIRHWKARKNGMLPLVKKAVSLLNEKVKPDDPRDL
jgi:hypothetical protein